MLTCGRPTEVWELGAITFTACVLLANFKVTLVETNRHHVLSGLANTGSNLLWLLVMLLCTSGALNYPEWRGMITVSK